MKLGKLRPGVRAAWKNAKRRVLFTFYGRRKYPRRTSYNRKPREKNHLRHESRRDEGTEHQAGLFFWWMGPAFISGVGGFVSWSKKDLPSFFHLGNDLLGPWYIRPNPLFLDPPIKTTYTINYNPGTRQPKLSLPATRSLLHNPL